MPFEKQGMNKEEIREFLKSSMKNAVTEIDEEGKEYNGVYLGSYTDLDPCGRYHHILSPNGITHRCKQFWCSMEKVAEELKGRITSGEGDPTDILFIWYGEEHEV